MIPLNERRGLNRQQSIEYLGVKPTYFENAIRPMLSQIRMGTCIVFDRLELDSIFERMQVESVGFMQHPERETATSTMIPLVRKVARQSRFSENLDFNKVVKQIKKKTP